MKFKYIGNNSETSCFGYTFKKDEHVDVQDEKAIARLSDNPCFEAVEEKTNPLHEEAKALGISFKSNIKDETLQKKIDAFKAKTPGADD